MGLVALKHLRWGDETIAPGDPVPEGEEGRDYASLLRTGHIGELKEADQMSNQGLRQAFDAVSSERDLLGERVAELEAGPEPIEIPEGVVPGETPGWPVAIVPLNLTEEQRAILAEKEISGEQTPEALAAVFGEPGAEVGNEIDEAETSGEEPAGQTLTEATDAAVKLADDNEIDLRLVTGTGKDGHILVSDVQKVIDEAETSGE